MEHRREDLIAKAEELFKQLAIAVSMKRVDVKRIRELCSSGTQIMQKINRRE